SRHMFFQCCVRRECRYHCSHHRNSGSTKRGTTRFHEEIRSLDSRFWRTARGHVFPFFPNWKKLETTGVIVDRGLVLCRLRLWRQQEHSSANQPRDTEGNVCRRGYRYQHQRRNQLTRVYLGCSIKNFAGKSRRRISPPPFFVPRTRYPRSELI